VNLTTFFEKFDLFVDAPDAIQKMRTLVLHLAVHGKLANQSEEDEPAHVLLRRSRAAMAERMAAGKAKREKPAEPVAADEQTFSLPHGWAWCRLVDAGQFINGIAFKPSDWKTTGRPIIRIQNLSGRNRDYNRTAGTFDDAVLVKDGDILVSWSATLDAFIWRGEEGVLNQHIFRVLPAPVADKDYLYWLLKWVIRQLAESEHAHGLVMSHINRGPFLAYPIPLPPLAEQKRIVAKVDELMALCDRLEAQQQERETRHAALARASLARFADAPTPANLELLFHKSYGIPPADLRKSILTLAFAGKLVLQDPNDEPASALLEKARAEKTRLIKAGLVKKEPWAHKLEDATTLYELPPGWEWTHVSDVVQKVTVGFVGSMKAEYRQTGVPFLRSQNVRVNRYEPVGLTFISDEFHRSISKSTLSPGDVVVTRSGNVGVTCVIPESLPEANCSDLVVVKRPIALVPAFLSYFINSIAAGQIEARTVGIALTHFNTQSVAQMTVALPPLAEQRRIVAKVDELMALVDQLEKQQEAAKSTGAALLEAVIHELLNPTAKIIPFSIAERDSLADRAAIGCYAIQRLSDQPTFGRTAEVKVLYMAEAHLGLDLGGRYMRDAAGPLDKWIYKFEEEAAREQWFSVVEGATKEGHKKIEYRKGPNLSAKAQEASSRLSAAQRSEFDRMLALLAQKPTVEVEIIATLLAAWNDFLIDGRQPNDDEIVREVRENWHPSKQRFSQAELRSWLAWLRQHALVPQGKGPHTLGQQGKLQLH